MYVLCTVTLDAVVYQNNGCVEASEAACRDETNTNTDRLSQNQITLSLNN